VRVTYVRPRDLVFTVFLSEKAKKQLGFGYLILN
jgi:hypothetical protein